MESIDTLISAFVVGAMGLLLGLQSRGLRSEMREEFRSVRGEIGELRREMHDEFRSVRGDLHEESRSIRSDLTQVALAVGVKPRAREA